MGDVIESQTSKNIQAAGKLTTTPSPKLRKEKSDPYECPNLSEFSFFPHYCSRHANCLNIGKEYRCCRQFNSKRCVKGVPKPLKEQRHERNLSFFFLLCLLHLFGSVFAIHLYTCSMKSCSKLFCLPNCFQPFSVLYRENVQRNHWPNCFGNWKRATPITIAGRDYVAL